MAIGIFSENRENTRNITGCHRATGILIFKKYTCIRKCKKIAQFFIVKLLLKSTKMQEMKPFS
jgi:hypothetical protein